MRGAAAWQLDVRPAGSNSPHTLLIVLGGRWRIDRDVPAVDSLKASLAAQAALAKLDTAADRVADLARSDSRMVASMTQASKELARAASAVRKLTEQESPTVDNVNAALKKIARAADALRLLAETLEQQPDAIWRGKKQKSATGIGDPMKLVRYGPKGCEKPGLIAADGTLRDLSAHVAYIGWNELAASGQKRLRSLNPSRLPTVRGTPRLGVPFTGISKILGIGLNYRTHAIETNMPIPAEPVIFMKATTCISGPNDPILMPVGSSKLDWEVELGLVIGRETRQVSEARALDHVAGYCVFHDVSERAFQFERGGQWDKGKGCDSFGPIGPWLVTKDEVADAQALRLWLDVNGERMQDSSTADMIFSCAEIVSYVSRFMTLLPGDVICTGTPQGVGMGRGRFLKIGDRVRLGVEGLGEQEQTVIAAQ